MQTDGFMGAMTHVGSDHTGRPIYWAEPGRFTQPGLYTWDGEKNVRIWAAEEGFKAPPVAGYNDQGGEPLRLVNANKVTEELTLRELDKLKENPAVDQRWLAVGRTHMEQAWMAVNRAIFKPGRVTLPEDAPGVG